eukprot:scaffold2053_cov112-Cylindrotheca_fusiformis.AAC.8
MRTDAEDFSKRQPARPKGTSAAAVTFLIASAHLYYCVGCCHVSRRLDRSKRQRPKGVTTISAATVGLHGTASHYQLQ